MDINKDRINEIIKEYPHEERYSLAAMQDIQKEYGYIPKEGIEMLAKWLNVREAKLYSMITFYKALSLNPKGKHLIKLCDGTACHIRGSSTLLAGVTKLLDIEPGETTSDGNFSLELVNCLGCCAIAPVIVVDEEFYGRMTVEKLPEIFEKYRSEEVDRQ